MVKGWYVRVLVGYEVVKGIVIYDFDWLEGVSEIGGGEDGVWGY